MKCSGTPCGCQVPTHQIMVDNPLAFKISKCSHILTHLPQVSTHSCPRCFRIVVDNAFKDALVMKLPALRATLNFKDLFALFTQQVNNGIYQDQNKCVLRCLRQRLVKIVVGCNKCMCVV